MFVWVYFWLFRGVSVRVYNENGKYKQNIHNIDFFQRMFQIYAFFFVGWVFFFFLLLLMYDNPTNSWRCE